MNSSRRYYRSSSFKMALLFTGLLSAAVLSLGYFLYDFGRQGYERESEAAIDAEIDNVLLELQVDKDQSIEEIISRRSNSGSGIYYLLTSLSGNKLAGDLDGVPSSVDRLAEGVILFNFEKQIEERIDQRKVAAKIHTFPDGKKLMVARDISEIANRFSRLRLLSLLSILCMFMVILVSFLISIFVVSRINRMSDTAMEIMETGDLSQRLAIDSRWDDLSHLSRVLNEMLARIESLLEGVKRVSDNIAHDLRTPLTRLRNRLEYYEQHPPSTKDIHALIAESDHILGTFHSLLRISRMDAGHERQSFEEVDVGQVLNDVCELYYPIVQQQSMDLKVFIETNQTVLGDRNLLFQALVNLLDNGVKHGGDGGEISCRVHQENEFVEVIITDAGPGISDEEKDKVFDRFYRCDKSRSTKGSGLGLSMVDSIVRLHKGGISLDNAVPNGLQVRMRLPISFPKVTKS